MNVIIFSSDCIRVFKDNPSSRRKYFNIQISQINKKYLINLNNYNLLLRQRNEFLKIINVNKKSDIDYFDIINDQYVDLSFEIFNYRKKYIDSVNKYIDDIFYSITGLHGLRVVYNSNISNLDKNMFIEKLKNNFNREIQYKMTFIGPNRDDFYFELDGKNLSIYKDAVKKAYDNKMEIGYHSYNHKNFKRQKLETIVEEFNESNEILKSITGDTFHLIRPPYGSINEKIKESLDASFILWNVDTEDWRHKNTDYLKDYVLQKAQDGNIILFHDIHKSSVDAIEKLLPYLYVEGYQVVTVSKLAKITKTNLELHKSYRYFTR